MKDFPAHKMLYSDPMKMVWKNGFINKNVLNIIHIMVKHGRGMFVYWRTNIHVHASSLAENDYIATTSDVFYPPFLYLRLFYLQVVPTQWLVLKLILWNIYPLTNLNFSTNGWISLNSMICLNASECVFRTAHEICISFF